MVRRDRPVRQPPVRRHLVAFSDPRLAGAYTQGVTEEREELIHLIDGLPDEKVGPLLTTARALSTPDPRNGRPWPPAFFGSIERASNGRTDNASRVDEFLAESGFGQDSCE